MSAVTYLHQPALHEAGGKIPLNGTPRPYTVSRLLWPGEIEQWLSARLLGRSLHVCCGMSQLGDVRLDLDATHRPGVQADAARLPFAAGSFDTVLCDPPYTGRFQWTHDVLNELHRIARRRIIFQNHFSPVNRRGQFKKANTFRLQESAVVPVMPASEDLTLAVRDGNSYTVVSEHGHPFSLTDLTFWQPRTYFGRVQLITIMDRQSEE